MRAGWHKFEMKEARIMVESYITKSSTRNIKINYMESIKGKSRFKFCILRKHCVTHG